LCRTIEGGEGFRKRVERGVEKGLEGFRKSPFRGIKKLL